MDTLKRISLFCKRNKILGKKLTDLYSLFALSFKEGCPISQEQFELGLYSLNKSAAKTAIENCRDYIRQNSGASYEEFIKNGSQPITMDLWKIAHGGVTGSSPANEPESQTALLKTPENWNTLHWTQKEKFISNLKDPAVILELYAKERTLVIQNLCMKTYLRITGKNLIAEKQSTPVTLKDIALLAGVTSATVSLVINNKPGISKERRKKVLTIARALNYCPLNNRARWDLSSRISCSRNLSAPKKKDDKIPTEKQEKQGPQKDLHSPQYSLRPSLVPPEPEGFERLVPNDWGRMKLNQKIDFVKKVQYGEFKKFLITREKSLANFFARQKNDSSGMTWYTTIYSIEEASKESKKILKDFIGILNGYGRTRLQYVECTEPSIIEIRELR